MSPHKRKNWLPHLQMILLLGILAFALLFPFLTGRRPFITCADQIQQYNPFYEAWERMLKKFFRNRYYLPFYTFESFLGNNFFASKAYYVTGDLLMPFLMLFPDIKTGLMWLEGWLLIVAAGYFFWLFLGSFAEIEKPVRITAAVLYAFSGSSALYIGQYMFFRAYALTPLVFLAVEQYRTRQKLAPFILSVFLVFLNLYYFGVFIAEFLLIYVPLTYAYHGEKVPSRKFFRFFFTLVLGGILGVMLGGALLVPAALDVLNNPRVGDGSSASLLFDAKVYLALLQNYATMPVDLFSIYDYPFQTGTSGHLTFFSFYSGCAAAPAVFGLYSHRKTNAKVRAIFHAEVALLPVMLLPVVSMFLHGMSEPSFRWTFLLVFFNLLIFALVYGNLPEGILQAGWKLYLLLYSAVFVLSLLSGLMHFSSR